jgi:uncharacterized protein (TIGR04255 family)
VNDIPDSRHPNSPLVEVVFEIRFPGETAIECRRHEFQEKIRSEYPTLWVPKGVPGEAWALEPYRFEKEDRSAGVMVALNKFAIFTRAYPGYDAFKPEILKLSSEFAALYSLDRLTRFGLRHVNIIHFVREEEGPAPLEDYFTLGEKLRDLLPGGIENFSTAFVSPAKDGKVTTRIQTVKRAEDIQEAFLLDFDYAMEGQGLRVSNLEDYLTEAHEQSADFFHRLVTPEYRDYIKGEEV